MSRLARAVLALNRSALWKRRVRVGPHRLNAPSLDRLIYLWIQKLRYERNADLRLLRGCLRPGMHVVDIGANIGVYSSMFAHAVGVTGRVIAFEPDPLLFEALVANARANNLLHIVAYQMALGDKRGSGRLNRGLFNSGDNRLVAPGQHATGSAVDTQITTLDEFLDGAAVDFIKMDVQGWEVHALRGMEKTLADNPRLQLYVELWPYGLRLAGSSADELFALITRHGFTFQIKPGDRHPSALDLQTMARREYSFANIYAYRP
jgi:FkbM family methyltransferase